MRLGLVGCGGIGRLRAEAAGEAAGVQLSAVSDLDVERRDQTAARHGAASVDRWSALVERDDVDAVLVCTPPSSHAEISIAAADAGKHVLCEKPLARDEAECRRMVAAAEASGVKMATGFNYRFYPSVALAREVLASGRIGELDHIRSYAGYSATEHGQAWLHDVDTMGGGALWDNGIHLIDLTLHFLGPVEDVEGIRSNRVWNYPGCEDNGFAWIRGPGGRIASVHASWTEWAGYRFVVELYGTLGRIRISCFPMITDIIWSETVGGRTRRKRHLFPLLHVQERLRSYRWVVTKSFVRELEEFVRLIDTGRALIATGGDGLSAARVAEAAEMIP